MNNYSKTLVQMKKAGKLVRLSQRKNGPKSYKRGQGALLRVLLDNDGTATQRELVVALGMNRGMVKDIVRKAERNGYVTIEDAGEKKLYKVKLTDDGCKLAEKHEAAQDKAAEKILSALTDEECAQLDAISEKLIVSLKEAGVDGKKKGHKAHRKHKKHRHCRH
jgi:DNA-binding MarR family transcriptional regulator